MKLEPMLGSINSGETSQEAADNIKINSFKRYNFNEGKVFYDYIGYLWRRISFVVTWIVICLGFSLTYLSFARIEYSATAQIALESRLRLPPGSDPSASALSPTLDSAQAESQVQVIKSVSNLRYVFDALNLEASFMGKPEAPSFSARIMSFFVAQQEEPDDQTKAGERLQRETAFNLFSNQVTVRRLGQSYILEVTYRASTAALAAKVANSIAASYIRGQIIYRAFSDQRSSDFLQGRISSLQSQRTLATEAVQSGIIPDVQFPDADARVVSPALLPLTKSSPQTKIILFIALIFSVLTSVGSVLLLCSFEKRPFSAKQVSSIFGIKCFAEIKSINKDYKDLTVPSVFIDPSSQLSIAMRALRSSIAVDQCQRGAIGFVSCEVTEATDFVAANLAFLNAYAGFSTLLIDADIGNPSLSRLLVSSDQIGLAEKLKYSLDQSLPPTFEIAEHLGFIAATSNGLSGDPNIFVGGSKFKNIVREAKGRRTTLIKFAPLDSSLDLMSLSADLNGIIFIVDKKHPSLMRLGQAIDGCLEARVNILGFVFLG